jgi:hypothetical protein
MAPAHSAWTLDLGAPSLATATRRRYLSVLPPGDQAPNARARSAPARMAGT